jgi:SPOR domain
MSRSGPTGQLGMKPQPRRSAADDLLRLQQNAQPITQPSQHWPPQQGYGQQPAPAYHFPQSEADAAQGYGQAAPGQSLPFPPQNSAQQQPFNRYPQPAPDPEANFGYGQQGQSGSAPPWGQQPDPRGYDLGSYMSSPGQGYGQSDPAHFQPPEASQFGAPHGYGETDAEFDEAMDEDEEEPRRGRRGLMIVAALVGAIGLGGGMAYAYKTIFPSRSGPTPVITNTQGPTKSKSDGQDGKRFADTDKKLLNRLGDEGAPAAPANAAAAPDDRSSDDPNAPRKVRLIPISPGGPQPAPAAAAPAAPPGLIVVPGMTVENMGPPPARAQYPSQPPPSAARVQLPPPGPPVKAVQQPQQPPVRVASAANMPPPAAAEPAAPVKKAPVVAKAAPEKSPVPKTKVAAAPPAATASSGAGYVAVLSSQKSRMDALKIFANMQEKYGTVLSSKTPDVQEANLGDKGVWYRLVVGPPGSRESASGLCSQLKTAGYAGCWVTSY